MENQNSADRKFLATSQPIHTGIVQLAGKLSMDGGQNISIREATDRALIAGLQSYGIAVKVEEPVANAS